MRDVFYTNGDSFVFLREDDSHEERTEEAELVYGSASFWMSKKEHVT